MYTHKHIYTCHEFQDLNENTLVIRMTTVSKCTFLLMGEFVPLLYTHVGGHEFIKVLYLYVVAPFPLKFKFLNF